MLSPVLLDCEGKKEMRLTRRLFEGFTLSSHERVQQRSDMIRLPLAAP